jgi:hypothetical protein
MVDDGQRLSLRPPRAAGLLSPERAYGPAVVIGSTRPDRTAFALLRDAPGSSSMDTGDGTAGCVRRRHRHRWKFGRQSPGFR